MSRPSCSMSFRKPFTAASAFGPSTPFATQCAAASHSEMLPALACSRTTSSDLCADAARGQIHDALERRIVGMIGDDAQVGQRILDFRALEEPQAAVHLVRNARRT